MASVLTRFDLAETLRVRNGLRRSMQDAPTMEAAARAGCKFLYDELITRSGSRGCALVRCYKVHQYGALPDELQAFARHQLPAGATPSLKMSCLTLLGTAGDEVEWNDRRMSKAHQVIPLPTTSMVEQAPMVAALFRAFGVDIEAVVEGSDIVRSLEGKSYGVFHVRAAKGSPHIPAQDFVERHGIRSVIGFGGSLKNGDVFAFVMFTKCSVPDATADRFRTVALDAKSAMFNFTDVFEGLKV